MPEKLVKISAYNTAFEANYAQNLLAEEGIQSCLDNEAAVGLFGVFNVAVGGVKLYVAEADADRAREILALSASEQPSDAISAEAAFPGGKCPHCQAKLEPGFEVCWSCGQPLEPQAADFANEQPETAPSPTTSPEKEKQQSSRVPPETPRSTVIEEADDLAKKAWFAAILGLFLCPLLLHVYSAFLIVLILANNYPMSRQGSRRLFMAAVVDLLVFNGVGWLVWQNIS